MGSFSLPIKELKAGTIEHSTLAISERLKSIIKGEEAHSSAYSDPLQNTMRCLEAEVHCLLSARSRVS